MPQESSEQPESKPEKDLTLQDQLAGFLIKVVKLGEVGIGSVYGLYSLFLEENAANSDRFHSNRIHFLLWGEVAGTDSPGQ